MPIAPAVSQPASGFTANQLFRTAFYGFYYTINFLLSHDLLNAIMTLPLFVAILMALHRAPKDQVGQIDIVALIYFLFFCIVPLQNVQNGVILFGEIQQGWRYPLRDFALVYALALFSFGCMARAVTRATALPMPVYRISPKAKPVLFIVAIIAFVATVFLHGGIAKVLTPPLLRDDNVLEAVTPATLAIHAIMTLMYMAAARGRPHVLDVPALAVMLLSLLFVASPLNVSRFALIGVWVPIVLFTFRPLLRTAIFYPATMFGLFVLVPLLGFYSRWGLSGEGPNPSQDGSSIFTLHDMNVVEFSLEAIAYVERAGFQLGRVLTSTVFIHVPRVFWPDKPYASNLLVGGQLADLFAYGNPNIAVPFMMDGYMDFGLVGAILYVMGFAYIFYLLSKHVRFSTMGFDAYTACLIGNFLILTRGTLAVVFTLFAVEVGMLALVRRFAGIPVVLLRPRI